MDPVIVTFVFSVAVTIMSIVLHEVAHGWVARMLGDKTAEYAGRLTLNPIKHLDPIGSVLIPIVTYVAGLPGFGWAKPVPYNPANLVKDMKYGELKVALAGPGTNILIAIVFGLLARAFIAGGNVELIGALTFIALVNAFLAGLNLIPIPPFDGSKILSIVAPSVWRKISGIGAMGFLVAFIVAYAFAGVIARIATFFVALLATPEAFAALSQIWGR